MTDGAHPHPTLESLLADLETRVAALENSPQPPPPTPPGTVVWSGDFDEEGWDDLYKWTPSGCADRALVPNPTDPEETVAQALVCNGDGGVRFRVEHLTDDWWDSIPMKGIYATELYVPEWWDGDRSNFLQWKKSVKKANGGKTKEPVAALYLQPDDAGNFDLVLRSKTQPDGVWRPNNQQRAISTSKVTAGSWYKVEVEANFAELGWFRISLDGELVAEYYGWTDPAWIDAHGPERPWEIPGPDSGVSGPWQFTFGHYLQQSDPQTTTILHRDPYVVRL